MHGSQSIWRLFCHAGLALLHALKHEHHNYLSHNYLGHNYIGTVTRPKTLIVILAGCVGAWQCKKTASI